MTLGCPFQCDTSLSFVPKVLYQTNRRDHEKLQRLNVAALCQLDQRTFYDDEMCETYILRMLGPRALTHYELLRMAAHRADFF